MSCLIYYQNININTSLQYMVTVFILLKVVFHYGRVEFSIFQKQLLYFLFTNEGNKAR